MRFLVKDKSFYKQLAAIAVPLALQNLITFATSLADTVMVGRLGEVQLSAVSIANQPGFIFMLLAFGTGGGAVVLIAQFWGKGDLDSIHKTMTIMYRVLFVAAVIFTSLTALFPREIVSVFTTDTDVIEDAAKFLRIVGFSYLFLGLASTTVTSLRAVREVRISLVVYICSFLTNVFLNWVLIFGNLGAPALGVEGAAIATCIARALELVITAIYIFGFEKKIKYRFSMLFARNLGIIRNFMENAFPVVINELFWGTGMAVVAIVVGRMGREFTAANAICSVLSQLVSITLFGLANATAVIVGNTVGKGDYKLARTYAHTLLFISLMAGFVSCAAVLLIKDVLLAFYNISPLARDYANQIMTIHAFIMIFVSMAASTIVGILRGGGDTRYALVVDIVFMWCLSIPLGFYTGLYLGWPIWAVYIVLKFDEVLKAFFTVARVLKGNWINDVTIKS